ncbi:MAG TPA: hypothetical protein PKE29_03805 [Phycisphaerales bacterium]|nr:hypothetical protein [Phycisphaerales bacterium]
MRKAVFTAAAALCVFASSALAWDAHGHRTIAWLGMDAMAARVPEEARKGDLAFVFAESGRAQVGYQSGEPDRYRAINLGQLRHENDPDHFIDIEQLEQFGLTLSTVPPLRYEYLRALAVAKHEHPESVDPYSEKRDPARTQEWPGFLPHAIMEHYGKLISSDRQVRVLGALDDPKRADQLAAARANVIFEMGQLAHFVGDAAQPLHTTLHHHGWIGPNPEGFTTAKGFHRYIDTTLLGLHHLTYDAIKGLCKAERTVDKDNPWEDVLAHIQRSFDQVRPLYVLQKTGELEKDAGKAFMVERLCDGGAMLGAMYAAAWEASAMSAKDVSDFVKYDEVSSVEPNPMAASKGRHENGSAADPAPPAKP